MRELDSPDLAITEFSIAPYLPSRNLILFPFAGKVRQVMHSPPSWAGTISWGTGDLNYSRHIEKRKLLTRFHAGLQGLAIVRLDLIKDYLPLLTPPDNLVCTVSSSRKIATGLEVTLSYQNKGDFVNTTGDFLNLGNRLYMITMVNNNTIHVIPEVAPTDNVTVELTNPFVKAVVDGSTPISRRGSGLITHSFPWYEYID